MQWSHTIRTFERLHTIHGLWEYFRYKGKVVGNWANIICLLVFGPQISMLFRTSPLAGQTLTKSMKLFKKDWISQEAWILRNEIRLKLETEDFREISWETLMHTSHSTDGSFPFQLQFETITAKLSYWCKDSSKQTCENHLTQLFNQQSRKWLENQSLKFWSINSLW